MSKTLYVLYEAPTGYALFKVLSTEEIGADDVALQKDLQEYNTFAPWVKLTSFAPFDSPENALEDAISISESLVSPFLRNFLSTALAKKAAKGEGWELGVQAPPCRARRRSTWTVSTRWRRRSRSPTRARMRPRRLSAPRR